MKLNEWLEHARLLVRVVEKDTCVHAEIEYEDLVQELAWFEELQAYRDTGLTPEQINKLKEGVGISDRKHGRWEEVVHLADGLLGLYQPYTKCSECGREVIGTLKFADKYCGNCGAEMENGGGKNAAD